MVETKSSKRRGLWGKCGGYLGSILQPPCSSLQRLMPLAPRTAWRGVGGGEWGWKGLMKNMFRRNAGSIGRGTWFHLCLRRADN